MVVHGFYHLMGYDHIIEEDKVSDEILFDEKTLKNQGFSRRKINYEIRYRRAP